jgi:MFS transporter, DHA1 family, inner membrane transport protein
LAAREYPGAAIGTVLMGTGAGYAAGVVGPPVRAISSEFDVSLTAIGLLTSLFFAGIVALNFGAPFVERLLGVRWAVRLAPLLMGVGGVISAVAPAFWVLLGGRLVVGLGVGLALVLGGIVGRAVGGGTLIGIYGGAITVAVAVSLALGGALASAGVGWRANFVVSVVLAFSAFPFFAGRLPATPPVAGKPGRALVRSFVTWSYWRVALLFVLAAGVPLIVSAWIVHYLTADDAMSAGAAGALGFVLFAVSTVARPAGGKVDERHHPLLLLASPFLAAAGFVLLAVDNSPQLAVPAIVAMGIGFSIPYAVSYIRSEDLVSGRPTVGLSAELLAVNVTPVVATPALGAAFEHGHAGIGWLVLAGFSVLAGVVNLPRPPAR